FISDHNDPFSNLKVFFICLILWGQFRAAVLFLFIHRGNVCFKGAENGEIDKKQRLSDDIEGKGEIRNEWIEIKE
ncbi:hypothetical protein, partial [Bacillus altitudinis]|uniref:hypothetical protein n=1 Tax=Bacillus altitudinis TaxID=293387 RepID=UPI0024ACDEB1